MIPRPPALIPSALIPPTLSPVPTAIEIHIDELIVHGLAPSDRRTIGNALERELTRLLTEQASITALAMPNTIDRLDGGSIQLRSASPAEEIASQLAHVVLKGINR